MKTVSFPYIRAIFFPVFVWFCVASVPAKTLAERIDIPPRVSIAFPEKESATEVQQVNIKYLISDSKPELVKVLIDGKLVQSQTDAVIGENEVTVEVPKQDCQISVIAQNKSGESDPAVINMYWFGPLEDVVKPILYVFAVGIGEYKDPGLKLKFAAKDAGDFVHTLMQQKGLLYADVVVKLLTDKEADIKNVREGLLWLQNKPTDNDVTMSYLAGHGINNKNGAFFYMPVNADLNKIDATCIAYNEIKDAISSIKGKKLIFMDACHSGNASNKQNPASNDPTVGLTGRNTDIIVFSSSTGLQFSLENPAWNNGAFTKAVVEGLNGKADLSGNGNITVKTLDYYVAKRVKELTKGKQAPVTIIPKGISDFTIAVVSNETTP